MVPIGWVAVGDPAHILPPSEHEQIWSIQQTLDFPRTVYGVTREASAKERMRRQAEWFAASSTTGLWSTHSWTPHE
jgi:hypothetical protein